MDSPSGLSRALLSPTRWALLATVVMVAGVFYLNLCDLIFDCGCRSWWNGAATLCNINDSSSRHCPWCSFGFVRGYLPLALTVVGQIVAVFWPRPMPFWLRTLLALAAFPLIGGITGLVYGIATGYWA